MKTETVMYNVLVAPIKTVTETEIVTVPSYGVGMTNGYTRGELRNFARVMAKRACRKKNLKSALKDVDDAIGYLEQLRENLVEFGPTAEGMRPRYSKRELFLLGKLLAKRSGHGKNAKRKAKDAKEAAGYLKMLAARKSG